MTSEITVFIPVYNGAHYIGRAIESVLGQTFHNLSLVIADNCSTDQTINVVEKYLSDSRVSIIRRPQNIGALDNFNDCLSLSKTKYFMILSHDDYIFSDVALQTGYQVLESYPSVPVVYADMVFVDQSDRPIITKRFGYNGLVNNKQVARRSIIAGRNYYSIPLLTRTEALNGLRYRENFPLSSDVDFAIALGENGNVYFIREVLLAIRFHQQNNTARTFSTLEQEFVQMADKHKIELSRFERVQMKLNNFVVFIQKKLFFMYLDKFRK